MYSHEYNYGQKYLCSNYISFPSSMLFTNKTYNNNNNNKYKKSIPRKKIAECVELKHTGAPFREEICCTQRLMMKLQREKQ
jgi:hypothetical protein